MAEKPNENWTSAVDVEEFWRRVQIIVTDRLSRLPREDRQAIAAATSRTTMADPEGGGWTRLWVDADGERFELGRVHAASFAAMDLADPN